LAAELALRAARDFARKIQLAQELIVESRASCGGRRVTVWLDRF
jgi:hypothetical protein